MVAIPRRAVLLPRNPGEWPDTTTKDYIGLIAIAVLIPVFIIGLMIFLYRRKYGRYPTFRRKQIINEAPVMSGVPVVRGRRYRRRGVWRAHDPKEGLPRYTIEAIDGEMSLGIGRKRTAEEEEYELSVWQRDASMEGGVERGNRTGDIEVERRRSSVGPRGFMDTRFSLDRRLSESLPPYVPPPAPAYIRETGISLGRMSSSSRRNSRGSFVAPSTRRSSRVL